VNEPTLNELRVAFAAGLDAVATQLQENQSVALRLRIDTGLPPAIEERSARVAIAKIRNLFSNVGVLSQAIRQVDLPAKLSKEIDLALTLLKSKLEPAESAISTTVALAGEEAGIQNAANLLADAHTGLTATFFRLAGELRVLPQTNEMTWQEAAGRLEQLRQQGERFKSRARYAKEFPCSAATIQKAIDNSKTLQGWAPRKSKAPPGVSGLTEVIIDRTPQQREADPGEVALEDADVDMVMAKLLNEADADERAELNSLSVEKRRELAKLVAKDPDASNRVWSRK
jgi:hypothetical protein